MAFRPVEYNEQNLARAIECQRKLEADLGGTEVYPALEEALKSPLTGAGWYKQIIFFTDGDVSNANEVSLLSLASFPILRDNF